MTSINLKLLQSLCPETPAATLQAFVEPLNEICDKYKINTKQRLAMFLAQVTHESGGLAHTVENLNYSAEALLKVFPKYFPTSALANQYARKPQAIANRVYASRMGNGNEASGDGWTYRGHGLIQLTGKLNIVGFSQAIGKSLTDTLAYLETPKGATEAAGWFWSRNNLNAVADTGDFKRTTQIINGGQNGAEDRAKRYQKALLAL